ncbi:hypothetical protein D3C78_1529650 [compost metagenome]
MAGAFLAAHFTKALAVSTEPESISLEAGMTSGAWTFSEMMLPLRPALSRFIL